LYSLGVAVFHLSRVCLPATQLFGYLHPTLVVNLVLIVKWVSNAAFRLSQLLPL
jgi:hypothetical protein